MRWIFCLFGLSPAAALAASPLSRLQGVSEHARAQAASGPDHLWAGLAAGLGVTAVIAIAAFYALRRRKTG
jgi:hypothetical protein